VSAPGEPSRLAAKLGPFRHRPFAIYWAGGLLSNLGTWLQAVAGSIFVYQLTGSALAVGLLNFAGFLPILLFSVAGGVISDRYDRRSIVIWTHVVALILATLLAALTFGGAVTQLHLIVIAFAMNTAYAIAKPSIISMLPALVPRDEVADAVGLNTLQFIMGQVAGPVLAAVAIGTGGAAWAFGINALTFLGPIVSMVYLKRRGLGAGAVRRRDRTAPTSSGESATSFVRQHRWVLVLILGVFAASAPLEIIRTLSPALVVERLGEPESAAGFIVAAQSLGSCLALAMFVPLRRRGWSSLMAAFGFLVEAAGLALAAFAGSLSTMAFAVGMLGFGFSLSFPVLTGTLQADVPDVVRGRVMAFHQMAHLGNRPFMALAAGGLTTLFGAPLTLLAGLILAPIGILATRRNWVRLSSRGGTPAPGVGPDGPRREKEIEQAALEEPVRSAPGQI
jgi:MFS family permease